MITRYLAVTGRLPIEIKFKSNITQSTLDCYINQYGLDFIGLFETYEQALDNLFINETCFQNLSIEFVDTIAHLERCLQLEYNGGI